MIVFAAALLVSPSMGPVRSIASARADSTVGEALLKSGRKALSKRQYDEAVSLFEKTLEEAPEMIEAGYWLAQAHDKAGRPKKALSAYRQFEAFCAQTLELSRELAALRKKSEKRIDSLAAGEKELGKLSDAFVKKLLAFAKKHAVRDPAMAGKALRRVIEVEPRNEAARKMAEQLDVELDAAPPAPVATSASNSPFDRLKVKGWNDLIATKAFSSGSIRIDGDVMRVDTKGGIVVASKEDFNFGDQLVYEFDVKVTEELARDWGIGLVIGWKSGNFLNVMMKKSEVLINLGNPETGPIEDLENHPMPPLKLGTFHRVGLKQRGANVEVYFDGKRIFKVAVVDTSAVKGEIAFFQQRCKAEFRQLRVAELE